MKRAPWILAAIALLAVALLLRELRAGSRTPVRATLSLEGLLSGEDTSGFARALEPRPFAFPRDHGEHPEYRTEWWYVTGHLASEDGRRFGYQLTFFRSALADSMAERVSAWAGRQAWMAHFALTDVGDGRFHAHEKFARGAAGLAGADTAPFRVWVGPWSIESADTTAASRDSSADAIFPLRLRAAASDLRVELALSSGKAVVLHGEAGLSRKGAQPGNASYYLSFTRMPSVGRVETPAGEWRVTGESWLDREWSTSGLPAGVAGWDWFALQLDDRSELMFYRLRRDDGTTDSFSAGTRVDSAGSAAALSANDVTIESLGTWSSPLDGARYPARWRIRVPRLDLDLELTPVLADQELNLAVRYWEGAVDIRGRRGDRSLRGRGYVELTGYGGAGAGAGRVTGRAAPPRRSP